MKVFRKGNCDVPKELDESALMDGCNRFQAFRHITIPVMSLGVITTGLFSFLLAYNDFAVTAMLLSQENQTMVLKDRQLPGIHSTRRPSDVGSCSSSINHGTSFLL
ncbi:uncharacterized protein METZ01_LOCUS178562 [marine metagenome]|uniref:ABC transmembrane type-1 domain-containing protein n=1 Tax=marine metagenome TaxID=408172 RepID=A0A382CHP3_9ZZZZ